MRLKIASRTSDLARIQAVTVGMKLEALHPEVKIEYQFKKSLGDINLQDPLWKMPEKGVFTEDFKNDLLQDQCDLVVHSWKDLPVESHPDTEIAATLVREDPRDLLLFKKSHLGKCKSEKKVRIFSSSPRREYNLTAALPGLLPFLDCSIEFEPVRGNVPTRIEKLMTSDSVDGLIVAKAGLDRLLTAPLEEWSELKIKLRLILKELNWMVLPLSLNPSAAGQGALAIEILKSRRDLKMLLAGIHDPITFDAVTKERQILKSYGGGCHQKIGVSVMEKSYGQILSLRGQTDSGAVLGQFEINRPQVTKVLREALWPNQEEKVDFFLRERVPAIHPGTPMWVSKSVALPEDWSVSASELVWASGVETWRKLSERGVWVSGCNDGLGESEPERIETLVGHKISFTKLSHKDAPKPALATYRLIPKALDKEYFAQIFAGKTHFFWSSGSLFEFCYKQVPEFILGQNHASGPGSTSVLIEKVLGKKPMIFTSLAAWRKALET